MSKHRVAMLFEDVTGRRRYFWLAFCCAFFLISSVWVTEFLVRVAATPPVWDAARHDGEPVEQKKQPLGWREHAIRNTEVSDCDTTPELRRSTWAFVRANDHRAASSVLDNCGALAGVIQEAFVIKENPESEGSSLVAFERAAMPSDKPRYLTVRIELGATLDTPEKALRALPSTRLKAINAHANDGVCLDVTGTDEISAKVLSQFLQRLAFSTDGAPRKICLIGSPDLRAWNDKNLIDQLDLKRVFEQS